MAVALEALIPEAGNYLTGAADEVLIRSLRRGAQQFSRDTLLWERSLGVANIDLPAGDYLTIAVPSDGNNQDFSVPAESRIIGISKVTLDGKPLPLLRRGTTTQDAVLAYAYDLDDQELTIDATVLSDGGELELFAVLEPEDLSMTIPNILNRWRMAIIDRALYDLLTMPTQEWSDPKLASIFLKSYNTRVGEGTVSKSQRGTQQVVRVAHHPFN